MYTLKRFHQQGLVLVALEGETDASELNALGRDLEHRLLDPDIPVYALLVDFRALQPMVPELAAHWSAVEQWSLQHSPVRVAELVPSELLATQLNRLSETAGTQLRLRHFWLEEDAFDWLTEPEEPGA